MSQDTTTQTPEEALKAALLADQAFQAQIDATPLTYDDEGVLRVRVGRSFYTTVQGQLVAAPIPRDLSRPTLWEPVLPSDLNARKARGMLGLPAA